MLSRKDQCLEKHIVLKKKHVPCTHGVWPEIHMYACMPCIHETHVYMADMKCMSAYIYTCIGWSGDGAVRDDDSPVRDTYEQA